MLTRVGLGIFEEPGYRFLGLTIPELPLAPHLLGLKDPFGSHINDWIGIRHGDSPAQATSCCAVSVYKERLEVPVSGMAGIDPQGIHGTLNALFQPLDAFNPEQEIFSGE